MVDSIIRPRGSALLAVPLIALLVSCGGGGGSDGGGGGGGGGGGLSVTLVNNSISWSYYPNQTPAAQVVNANISGTYSGNVFAGAVVENAGATNPINPNIQLSISATQATASVRPAANLAPGTYTGRILFLACSDQACGNRIGGTPLPVTYTVNVLSPVSATPAAITRTVTSGVAPTDDIVVTPGTNETGFTMGQTASFATVSNQTAGGFKATLRSLPVGTYTGNIVVNGSAGSLATIPINYTVTAPAGGQQPLSVNPTRLTLNTVEGDATAPQTISVTQPTWQPGLQTPVFSFVPGAPTDWLQVTSAPGGYQVVASATNLSQGVHLATIIVAPNQLPNGVNDPFGFFHRSEISVALTVGPGFVTPADVVRVIDSETGAAALTATIPINVAGGPAVTWNAVSSEPGRVAVTASGTTGSSLTYTINENWLRTQAVNFQEYVTTISITGPAPLTPTSFDVIVRPQFAEVSGAGARVQIANRPTQLIVAGRGFMALANPAARISVSGATPTSVQVVNDRKLLLDFASLSLGTHTLSISNTLNKTTSSRGVVAVTPASHAYASVPNSARIGVLVVDHENGVLYGVHPNDIVNGSGESLTDGRLFRFRPGSSGWTIDSPAPVLEGVDDVGVLNDGNIVVKTSPGTLRVLDRTTLNEVSSLDITCHGLYGAEIRGGMPVTLDGRVWLSKSNNQGCKGRPRHSRLGTYDPAGNTYTEFEVEPTADIFGGSFMNGPDFLMPRTGERLMMDQETMYGAPIVYLDASDSILKPSGPLPWQQINSAWGQSASASDDGSRLLLDAREVLNSDFDRVGHIAIPNYAGGFGATEASGIISPDGTRAYVLTYHDQDVGQAPPHTFLPRVYVLDTSGDVGDNDVPVLGFFELPDYPNCIDMLPGCAIRPPMAISLDGRTLFIAGESRFIVAPIPSEGVLHPASIGGVNAAGAIRTRLWRSGAAAK